MTRQELRANLAGLGISHSNLADLVAVTPRAVSLWMTGARGIPGPVSAYVQLLVSLPPGMRQAELSRHTKDLKTMKDGMYLIGFTGRSGTGHGMLIFDGGRIYGADVSKGKYDGEYIFNEKTGLVDVSLRVEMPAGVESVVGMIQRFDWILEVFTEFDPAKDCGELRVRTNLGEPINANYQYLRSLPVAA